MTPEGQPGEAPALAAHSVYDGAEVDAYLADIHRRLESLQVRLKEAIGRAEAAERRLDDSAWSAALIGRTLVVAQRTAERTIREAQDEAGATLAAARARALDHLSSSQAQAQARIDEATEAAQHTLEMARKSAASTSTCSGDHVPSDAQPPPPSVPAPSPAAPEPPTDASASALQPPPPAHRFSAPTPVETPAVRLATFEPPAMAAPVVAPTNGKVAEGAAGTTAVTPPSSSDATERGSSSLIVDMRDRWRAARSGSVAIFEADEDQGPPSDYFAELRSAVEHEVDSPPTPRPAARPSAFEDASYLVAFPAWAAPSRSRVETTVAADSEGDTLNGAVNGNDERDTRSPGPFGRFGFLMLGMLSPAPMTHRRRRRRHGRG